MAPIFVCTCKRTVGLGIRQQERRLLLVLFDSRSRVEVKTKAMKMGEAQVPTDGDRSATSRGRYCANSALTILPQTERTARLAVGKEKANRGKPSGSRRRSKCRSFMSSRH